MVMDHDLNFESNKNLVTISCKIAGIIIYIKYIEWEIIETNTQYLAVNVKYTEVDS